MQAWERNLRTVWVANFVTSAGLQSFLPFFPSHLEAMGVAGRDAVQLWSGLVYGIAPLAAAISGPLWGALGDRIGRKLMVLRSMLAIALFVGLMAWAHSPWELLVLRSLQGLFAGFIAPSITLVSVGAPREVQGRISASLQTALVAGAIVGPLLGGWVASSASLRAVFLLVSGCSLASALVIGFAAHEQHSTRSDAIGQARPGEVFERMRAEIVELWRNPQLRLAMLLLFWIQLAAGATQPLMELFVRDLWTGDAALEAGLTSWMFAGMALANLGLTPVWGRYGDKHGHRRALLASAGWSGVALCAHALAPNYWVAAAARVGLGAATAGSSPCAFGIAAAETAVERRGGAFGAMFSARALAVACSAMLGGALAGVLGLRGLFLLGGLGLCLAVWRLARPVTPQPLG